MSREHLDDRTGEANLDDLCGQLIGNGVVVVIDLDVIVDVDLGCSPRGELVTRRGQRAQRRSVEFFEE